MRDLKKEKSDLKLDLKRAFVGLKKLANLERDYNLLMTSFEQSERLRNEQKLMIDGMRAEIKRLNDQVKKKSERANKQIFSL